MRILAEAAAERLQTVERGLVNEQLAGAAARRPQPMIVSNCGFEDRKDLALFVVDANQPFSSPAKLD